MIKPDIEHQFWLSIILERLLHLFGLVTNYAGYLEDVTTEVS